MDTVVPAATINIPRDSFVKPITPICIRKPLDLRVGAVCHMSFELRYRPLGSKTQEFEQVMV
ncbi:hypothetical protein TRICHSKD4_0312 [Roseibium sp. TrichSKD4]|nr:hypothetical protein TRICHSKD4_0312 [Roseibium sp. TrichSKD4]